MDAPKPLDSDTAFAGSFSDAPVSAGFIQLSGDGPAASKGKTADVPESVASAAKKVVAEAAAKEADAAAAKAAKEAKAAPAKVETPETTPKAAGSPKEEAAKKAEAPVVEKL